MKVYSDAVSLIFNFKGHSSFQVNELKKDETKKPTELCQIICQTLTKDFYLFPPLLDPNLGKEAFNCIIQTNLKPQIITILS